MIFYAQSTGTVISGRQRETDRQTQTERQTQRLRQTKTEKDREAHRETETKLIEIEKDTERDRVRENSGRRVGRWAIQLYLSSFTHSHPPLYVADTVQVSKHTVCNSIRILHRQLPPCCISPLTPPVHAISSTCPPYCCFSG